VSVPWKYFVLKPDKTPYPNCDECRDAGPEHDRETCPHLVCHGFYAATGDERVMHVMMDKFPDSRWAVRTGRASGIIVIDAEGDLQPQGITGVDVLDDFETWTGGLELPTTGLIASTPSGGIHRYYRYPHSTTVKSRNRVLPGIDIKSDGGYVLVPMDGETDREWYLNTEDGARELSEAVVDWLTQRRGRSEGGLGAGHREGWAPEGYDFERFSQLGCPGGMRDEFFNELIFRYRKAGLPRAEVVQRVRAHWKNSAQPPAATYYMPWHHVEYKIERIWRTVEPDTVPEELRAWAERTHSNVNGVGRRVALAPRVTE